MPVPTDDSRFGRADLWRLAVLLAFALCIRGWLIAHTEVTARDSLGFIRYAMQLATPPVDPREPSRILTRGDIIKSADHPPGYPVAVWQMSSLVRSVTHLPTTDTMTLSAQLVSGVAAVLLCLPIYWIGRLLFDRNVALLAGLWFVALPICAQVTSDGLSDALYLLMATTGLGFAVWGFRGPTWAFGCAGFVAGLSYLVRPEGLIVPTATGLTLLGALLFRKMPWKTAGLRLACMVVGWAVVGVPYIVHIGKLTNKTTGGGIVPQLPSSPEVSQTTTTPTTPFAAVWWVEDQSKYSHRGIWAVQAVVAASGQTAHYFAPLFALFGLIGARSRFFREMRFAYVGVLLLVYYAVLWAAAFKGGYIAQRHTLLPVLLGSYFAADAVIRIGGWLAQAPRLGLRFSAPVWTAACAALLIGILLPQTLRRLHANRAGHHAAGLWLAAHLKPEEGVWDPFAWAEFYAGRAHFLQSGTPPDDRPTYVVTEVSQESAHPHLPKYAMTQWAIEQNHPVFVWPPNRKPTLIIYRWEPPARGQNMYNAAQATIGGNPASPSAME